MEIASRNEVQTSSCPSADLAEKLSMPLPSLGKTIGYWLFYTEQSGSVMWVPMWQEPAPPKVNLQ